MDPVNALSLAAAVVQFVQFASTLFTGTCKIYQSANGSSTRANELDSIYTELSDLSSSLEQHHDPSSGSSSWVALKELASSCKADCDELLSIVRQLKVKRGSRRWLKSFLAALKEVMNQDDISRLQESINQRQTSMILSICAISSENTQTLQRQGEDLKLATERLGASHMAKLQSIESDLSRALRQLQHAIPDPQNSTLHGVDIGSLTTKLAKLSLTSRDVSESLKSEEILASLDYDQAPVRHANITEAHERTFGWTLRESGLDEKAGFTESNIGKGNVHQWLQAESGIFWISGKPGSGKSTLMKFIADHAETKKALSSWASPLPIVVASHYFWSIGKRMQRSQQGLWQSLLFQALKQGPRKLISEVCPDRWHNFNNATTPGTPWSILELQQSFQRLVKQQSYKIRFCFFIDGLDEFEGDHLELVQALIELACSPVVKLCVSSRPWNVFEANLGQSRLSKIYLHELTRKDILNFSESRLTQHPRWASTVGPEAGESLITTITDRAQGVFLWVFLVTKLLREGLTNDDTLSDLHRMLDSVPPDLEQFFKQMLDSVGSVYHQKMAGFLEITLAAREPLEFSIYHFHELEYNDPDFALKECIGPFSANDISNIRSRIICRLDALCKGLLEVSHDNSVQYIHRTVSDWLRTPAIREFLEERTKSGFDARVSILRAFLARYKHPQLGSIVKVDSSVVSATTWTGTVVDQFNKALSYVEDENFNRAFPKTQIYPILDNFSLATLELIRAGDVRFEFSKQKEPAADAVLMLRSNLFCSRLWPYLSAKCQQTPDFFQILITSDVWMRLPKEPQQLSNEARLARRQVVTPVLVRFMRQFLPEDITDPTGSTMDESAAKNFMTKRTFSVPNALLDELGADPNAIVESASGKITITTGVGFLVLIFTFMPSDLAFKAHVSKKTERIIKVLKNVLNEQDHGQLMQKFNSSVTPWDVICCHIRALGNVVRNPERMNFLSSVVETLINNVRGISRESWKDLQDAVSRGFPQPLSQKITMHMDDLGLTNKARCRKRLEEVPTTVQPKKRAKKDHGRTTSG